MAYRVIATQLFDKSSERTIKWLRKEWSDNSAQVFTERFVRVVDQIILHPTSGKRSAKFKNVRSVLITRYNRLYYRISNKTITLHFLR